MFHETEDSILNTHRFWNPRPQTEEEKREEEELLNDPFSSMEIQYRYLQIVFLGEEFSPLISQDYYNARLIFSEFAVHLFGVRRWENYQVRMISDGDLATHAVRQTGLIASAFPFDRSYFGFDLMEKDCLLSAALLHDLGEFKTQDVTYDLKDQDRKSLEISESQVVLEIIDRYHSLLSEEQRERLKEIYLRITTSFDDVRIEDLLKNKSFFPQDLDWSKMRDIFKLYERYSYLITAIELLSRFYPESEKTFGRQDQERLKRWNREELEVALKNGKDVSEEIRALILIKNVALNQWKYILEASKKGIPSAKAIFNDPFPLSLLKYADEVMGLNLDFSFS